MWARVLVQVKKSLSENLDMDYLTAGALTS
ncbi:hypothetical protein BMS3Bbin05_02123 [bacterium BMS3Bbin05]|nr:hypothetical protein BMS3Bbin05_02123 [bacterium BMS3Bbin05]